jgi:hypothetical protein
VLVDWTDRVLVGCWAIVRRSRLEERRGRRNQDDGVGKPTTLTEGRGFDEEKTGCGRVVEISTSPASPCLTSSSPGLVQAQGGEAHSPERDRQCLVELP